MPVYKKPVGSEQENTRDQNKDFSDNKNNEVISDQDVGPRKPDDQETGVKSADDPDKPVGVKSGVREHRHDNIDLDKIRFETDISGFIETVTDAPTHEPESLFDQIKLRVDGATIELYIYDTQNNTWRVFT